MITGTANYETNTTRPQRTTQRSGGEPGAPRYDYLEKHPQIPSSDDYLYDIYGVLNVERLVLGQQMALCKAWAYFLVTLAQRLVTIQTLLFAHVHLPCDCSMDLKVVFKTPKTVVHEHSFQNT